VSALPIISFHPTLSGDTTSSWPQSLTLARQAGFRAMDIVLPEVAVEPAERISDRLAEAAVRAGPASLPVEFRLDEDTFRRDVAKLPGLASLAGTIGVKTMFRSIPASSPVPAAELLPTIRRRISVCAAILGEHGIDFAIEVLGPLHRRREAAHEFIWHLPEAADLAASCDGDVGLLVDSWHWHHAGGTVEEIVALGALVRHVHVADAADLPAEAVRDEERMLPGAGIVDLAAFTQALDAIDYTGFVSPEVRGYVCRSQPVACAREGLRMTRTALGIAA
jgi:sugar phosphate isomerase/epimerase